MIHEATLLEYFPKDKTLAVVKAQTFPRGVKAAFESLHAHFPNRVSYGISFPDASGQIQYWAGVELLPDDTWDLETRTIRSGLYLRMVVPFLPGNEKIIGQTFAGMLQHGAIDTDGYCLEIYEDANRVTCAIPLDAVKMEQLEKAALATRVEEALDTFANLLAEFTEPEIHAVPANGTWTIAQLADHVQKASSGVPDETTIPAYRPYNQQVIPLANLFLDFTLKMISPDFVAPGTGPFSREELVRGLQQNRSDLKRIIREKNLFEICTGAEMPGFGNLTRYEWISFIVFHTQRHTQQLRGK